MMCTKCYNKLKAQLNDSLYDTSRARLFLDICKDVYNYYMQNLREADKIDFDDMILQSIDLLDFTPNFKYKYIIVDDIKETAAVYPYENTHDDIMWSDIDFIIWAIDMALSGELVSSDYSEETKDSFTEVYRIESDESLIFEFGEGKLIGMVFLDKSGNVIAVYEINYAQKGGKKSLFDYKDYKVTNMRVTTKTEETTTEE